MGGDVAARILALVVVIAGQVGVDPQLAKAVVITEGAYHRPDVIGRTGDLGVMQLNPDYIDWMVESFWDKRYRFNWRVPEHNIYVGLTYLKYLLSFPEFNTWQAVIAYNCGPYAVLNNRPPRASLEYADKVGQLYPFNGR